MSKIMDAQNRLYDRMRHKRAFEVAREHGTAPDFEALRGHRQALVVTFKRSGEPVPTPVNFGLDDQGRLYFRSEPHVAKIRRIRNDPHVRVCSCNIRGKPTGAIAEGRARIVPPEESDHAAEAVAANWSAPMRVFERGGERFGIESVYVEVTPA
jgi:PPOX class probable F420-dependent enzyme